MDPVTARKCWRTLEPYHGLVYFAPEPVAAYEALGLERRHQYFASRAAALGPVPAEVVIATFYNFHPGLVRAAIPDAWERADPAAIGAARLEGVDGALRRILGDDVLAGPEVEEALGLARAAATEASEDLAGRPLFAAHVALDWPDEPHLALWHAVTLLREHRGDGHVAALFADEVGPCEALVMHGATGDVPADVLRETRAWSDAEWATGEETLRERGWLDSSGALTEEGQRHRSWVEDRTDELALRPWEALGDAGCTRLRELVRPLSRAIAEGGIFRSR